MSPSSPPVRPLQNPHAALSSLRTRRLRMRMPSSRVTLPASLVAPALPIAHCPLPTAHCPSIAHRPSAPSCNVYRSAFALLRSPSWPRTVLSPLPLPHSRHTDCWLFARCHHNGAFAAPLPTSPAPPPHHPTPPGPVEKGDVDGGRPCHLRPLPRHLFSLSCRHDGPSPAPSRPILTARRRVLPLAPARKGM
ncbi:hypothetical protein V8E53_011576 [Lactarius tabidus]